MNYKYQLDLEITRLLKFIISYDENFKAFKFNDTWVNEINDHFYKVKITIIMQLLAKYLKHGLKQAEYLEYLKNWISKKLSQIENYELNSIEFFESYTQKISTVNGHSKEPTSNSELFKTYKEDNKLALEQNPDLVNYLNFFSKKINNLKTEQDFEKGLLLYALNTYKDALKDLHGYIYEISNDAEYIDFKSIDLGDWEESTVKEKKHRLGHLNLSKKKVAHFFRILLEENYLVFDEKDDAANRLEMKRFVEDNFTFKNLKKERSAIKTFRREYSEVCSNLSPDVKEHKDFIDKLISKLQTRKDNLKD
ncbi:hypothetical protein [Psychroflexus sp. MES1-P1E]|uniref:hypothetical protein n=1 Tax=Psychroflexus sp. MES1-P1E TaxID=2058320 RepID=UPI000C7BBD77|nr:hypothetical protein [Psychroflexus sp. MES1-P1E]PKG44022.1 hypothetical protein CXF67_01850 [Psychroflexus sp. MES1-P1E]